MLPSSSHMTRRALLMCTVLSSLVGVSGAQSPSMQLGGTVAFAQPWNVSLQHIHDAMTGKSGAYALEQIRRGYETGTSTGTRYVGTMEHLLYQPADTTSKTGEKFRLQFRGIEGRNLTSGEFTNLSTLFAGKAGFTFRYKGFHVADPVLAAKTYDLIFLTTTKRSTKQGTFDVYRVAVIPKRWDRTAWLLELDTRTGYPLYAGEYSLGPNGIKLQSEVIVTSYLMGFRAPNASWWSPLKGIQTTPTALDAVKKALTKSTTFVTPAQAELPGGFQLAGAEVHTDPFGGGRLAVLRYTDGVDHLFVTERNVPVTRRGEDSIKFLHVDGVIRCAFTHRGVSFDVVGRDGLDSVRRASVGIYARAIRVLK